MKKILFFISSLMLFISGVKAEVEYSDWVTELDPNIVYEDVIEEKRYRFFKEEKIGEYISVNKTNESNYEYVDETDFIISDYSELMSEVDKNMEYELVESVVAYPYQKIMDTYYIHFENFSNNISFEEIKVYNGSVEVGYKILSCDSCAKNYENICKEEKIILKLDKPVDTSKISLLLNSSSKDMYSGYNLIGSVDEEGKLKTFNRLVSFSLTNYSPKSNALYSSVKTETLYTTKKIESDIFTTVYEPMQMYRVKEKLIYHYNIKKEYYDDNYHVNVEGYIKELEDYKIFYKYLVKENNNSIVNEEKKFEVINEETYKNNYKSDSDIELPDNKNFNIESLNNVDNKKIENNELNQTPIISTMKIKNKTNYLKYIILIVITLTIIYIYYNNKKYVEKNK